MRLGRELPRPWRGPRQCPRKERQEKRPATRQQSCGSASHGVQQQQRGEQSERERGEMRFEPPPAIGEYSHVAPPDLNPAARLCTTFGCLLLTLWRLLFTLCQPPRLNELPVDIAGMIEVQE